jgi:hypothetical protein
MQILFLHGWNSVPGGVKPTYLKDHGHEIINPKLPDEDFAEAVRIAQAEFDKHQPQAVVGSSRGGAVAMNINSGDARLVLHCPAWRKHGTARTLKPGTVILQSRADDVVPFADSEELVKNSGLPASALVEVGTDHRLADPEPLAAMCAAVAFATPILCLGIDVAWWGGQRNNPESQRDTIVYTTINGGIAADLIFRPVNLSAAANPKGSDPTEPNTAADGSVLGKAVSSIIKEHEGRCSRFILALDTPVEAAHRPTQPARIKAGKKGQKTGAERRQCERELEAHKKSLRKTFSGTGWNALLKVQSGSPVSPRMRCLLRQAEMDGFSFWRTGCPVHDRQLIEIFPSEAIWSLGVQGRYPGRSSSEVRAYKRSEPKRVAKREAWDQAMATLSGFTQLFDSPLASRLPVPRWAEQIADYACGVALDDGGTVSKGKGFDDPIESGIALLTGIAFLVGSFHAWGDGSDGTIVGPGQLSK